MDPAVKDEAIRRLQEEIRREEEAVELAKQKTLDEQKAAEARIHEEFIRLRAEEERVRIEAEKLALQAQAKRLADQKEAAIQEELERLRNRSPFEVLRDDFKSIVKKLTKLETKPDHTEPISGLDTKLSTALEENKRLQAQITALTTGFQAKFTALSTELNSVKEGKAKEEATIFERLAFIEKAALNSNKIPLSRQFLSQKNIRRGYTRFQISKNCVDNNQFVIKFSDYNSNLSFNMRFSRTDKNIYMCHQLNSRGRTISPEKVTSSGLFETIHRNQSHLSLLVDIYSTKVILKSPNGAEVYTYIPEGGAPNEIYNWAELIPDLSEAQGCSCLEQE